MWCCRVCWRSTQWHIRWSKNWTRPWSCWLTWCQVLNVAVYIATTSLVLTCSVTEHCKFSTSLLTIESSLCWMYYGDHSFSVNGPVIWNSLPHELRSTDISLSTFRKRLKAFLFDTDTRHSTFAACTNFDFITKSHYYYYFFFLIIIIISYCTCWWSASNRWWLYEKCFGISYWCHCVFNVLLLLFGRQKWHSFCYNISPAISKGVFRDFWEPLNPEKRIWFCVLSAWHYIPTIGFCFWFYILGIFSAHIMHYVLSYPGVKLRGIPRISTPPPLI